LCGPSGEPAGAALQVANRQFRAEGDHLGVQASVQLALHLGLQLGFQFRHAVVGH
jgi:hypothetical protein